MPLDSPFLRQLRIGTLKVPAWEPAHFHLLAAGEGLVEEAGPQFRVAALPQPIRALWVFTLGGFAHARGGGHQRVLDEGRAAIFTLPSEEVVSTPPAGLPWRFLFVALTGEFATAGVSYLRQRFGAVHHLGRDSAAASKARRLAARLRSDRGGNAFDWAAAAHEWFHAWWEAVEHQAAPGENPMGNRQPATVAFGAGTIQQYAHEIGYSPSHLSRRLKAAWGRAPGEALRAARLEEACRLLRETDLPATDVAEKCGYLSASAFSRAFHRLRGMTPIKYREAARRPPA